MKLVTSEELLRATNLKIPGAIVIARALMQIFRYNKINKIYESSYAENPLVFIDSTLRHLDVQKIPRG